MLYPSRKGNNDAKDNSEIMMTPTTSTGLGVDFPFLDFRKNSVALAQSTLQSQRGKVDPQRQLTVSGRQGIKLKGIILQS